MFFIIKEIILLKNLKELAIKEVRDNTTMKYEDIEDCYVHIDFIF